MRIKKSFLCRSFDTATIAILMANNYHPAKQTEEYCKLVSNTKARAFTRFKFDVPHFIHVRGRIIHLTTIEPALPFVDCGEDVEMFLSKLIK